MVIDVTRSADLQVRQRAGCDRQVEDAVFQSFEVGTELHQLRLRTGLVGRPFHRLLRGFLCRLFARLLGRVPRRFDSPLCSSSVSLVIGDTRPFGSTAR